MACEIDHEGRIRPEIADRASVVFFSFTSAERVALDTIREERPGILDHLRARLDPVLSDVAQDCQGSSRPRRGRRVCSSRSGESSSAG